MIYVLISGLVPSKGSALDELLARTVRPSGEHLSAAVPPDAGSDQGQDLHAAGIPAPITSPQQSPILSPSAILCLKTGIELEYTQ